MPAAAGGRQQLQVTFQNCRQPVKSNQKGFTEVFASQSGLTLSPAAQHEATGPDGKAVSPYYLQGSRQRLQICNTHSC